MGPIFMHDTSKSGTTEKRHPNSSQLLEAVLSVLHHPFTPVNKQILVFAEHSL